MAERRIVFLFFVLIVAGAMVHAEEGDGMDANSATITPAKKEVLAGEQIEVIVHRLIDKEGSLAGGEYFILVKPDHGRILNGEDSEALSGARRFRIGEGILKIQYSAPVSAETDTIRVFNAWKNWMDGDSGRYFEWVVDEIGQEKISVIIHNIAQLGYYHHYHSEQDEPFTLEMDVNVAIHFEPIKVEVPGKRVSGFGSGIPYRVKSAAVISFSGTAQGKDCDYQLVSATPINYQSTVTFYMNPSTGAIESVLLPRFSATLAWEGEEGYVPPEQITFEPVNEWDNEEAADDLEKKANKLEAQMEAKNGVPDLNMIMEIQKSIQGTVVHPEYQVQAQFERNYVSGGGEFSDSGEGWTLKKRFKWDAQRKN